jgi:branched-chain amino acid transport system substrate-binding protein
VTTYRRTCSRLLAVTFLGAALSVAACGSSSSSSGGGSASNAASSGSSSASSSSGGGAGSLKCKNGHILIGIDKAQSGPASFFDTAGTNGLLVAVHDINAAGGINGCKLSTINMDDQSNPGTGAQVATEEVSKGIQILVVGDDFDSGVAAAQVGEKAGLLVLSLAASSTQFGIAVGPHMFNGGIDTTVLGSDAAKFSLSRGWKTAFEVLDPSLAYFTLQDKSFRAAYTGGKIVGTSINKSYEGATADFSSAISQIQSSHPAVIYDLLTFPAAGSLVKQLRDAGITTPVVGDVTLDTRDLLPLTGAAGTQNVYYVTQVFWVGKGTSAGVSPAMVKFGQEYQSMFGKFPEQSNAPEAYQVFYAIADALKKPGVTDVASAATAINAETNLQVPGGTLIDWKNGYAVWNGTIVGFSPPGTFHKTTVIASQPGQ